jgi:hypothetical protein
VCLVEVGSGRLTIRRKLTIAGDMHLLDLSQVRQFHLGAKVILQFFTGA